jgi:transcriptional regulator with XRE-family HTH domain
VLNDSSDIVLIELGKRITNLRKSQNLTKVQLAFEINTSESNIRRIEKGSINVGVKTLYKIAKALNIEMKELFDFEVD